MYAKPLFLFLLFSQLMFSQFEEKYYQPSKPYKPIENADFSEFKIPVENDTISGIFLHPKTKAKASILFFHGTGGNVSSYVFMTKPLVDAGYQVLMVDFRGYGKSTGTPTHLNIASDAQKFLDYAIAQPQISKKPIILYGASMGTEAAAHLASMNNDKIAGLILEGTVSSFTDVAIHFAPDAEYFLKNVPFPYSAKEDIKKVAVPKIIIHSAGDKTIPIEEGKMVYDNAPQPKLFVQFTGDHLEGLANDKDEILKDIDAFILKRKPLK